MPKFKYVDNSQNVMIPIDLTKQLLPGTFEHSSCLVIDQLDLSILESKYNNDDKGAYAYPPSLLLKIIINAYRKGIINSRGIEALCLENIMFMSITGGLHPDHSTISHFITSMEKEILDIFSQVLVVCNECGLIDANVFAVDGCKISSNTSKEWSGTFKELEKKKSKLKATLMTIIQRHRESDNEDEKIKLIRSKQRVKKKIFKISNYLDNNEPKMGSRGHENKSNITDNTSAKMHSPHGVIQGHNGIVVADKKYQIVLHADVFGNVHEGQFLPELLNQTRENIKKCKRKNYSLRNKMVLADADYFSESNCEYIFKNKINGYIPDRHFRERDPRYPDKMKKSKDRNKYRIEDFEYNNKEDKYICPARKSLIFTRESKRHSYNGRLYYANKKDCSSCMMHYKCIRKGTKNRSLFIITDKLNITNSVKMSKKIDSKEGRNIYTQRMGIVEPVFANICFQKRMNRFLYRGRSKVRIQWLLFNLVHNIGKITNYGDLSKLTG